MSIYGTDAFIVTGDLDFSINIILPDGLLEADRYKELLDKYASAIAGEARDFWISEAGRRLKSSRQRYQDSIVLAHVDGDGFMLMLTDPLAAAVEVGAPGFDMRPGLMGKVVPMNLGKQATVSDHTFRTVNKFTGKWKHPGWEGKNIADDVITEIVEVIVPKYVQKVIEEI